MPRSKQLSIAGTMSTCGASDTSGVKLTPVESTASSFSSKGAIIYTPSTASGAMRTPTASIVSTMHTRSTNLNAVFARLDIDEQRKALRIQPNSVLGEALGCTPREVPNLILTSTSDELWGAFCRLNIETRKKSLDGARKTALKKAFDGENHQKGNLDGIASYSASITPSDASTNILALSFEKLNVTGRREDVTSIQQQDNSRKDLRGGESGRGLDQKVGITDKDEKLLYGDDSNKPDLAEWQELCRACGVEEIPGSITKCKEILKTKNVALADLSHAIEYGTVAQTFPSLSKLRKYVVAQNKVADKKLTKQNKFLKRMLRELFRYSSSSAKESK